MDATELSDWLSEAWKDHQGTWAVVDHELYDLCARKGHDRLEDVYAKVAIINRVYAAGIARSVAARGSEDAELLVSRLLVDCRDQLSECLAHLEQVEELTSVSMVAIVAAHGSLTRRLASEIGGVNLCSFLSKYLHFHCPSVPIYDSRVAEHIAGVLGHQVPRGTRTDRLLPRPPIYDPSYYWYTGRFLKLWELVQESTPGATVKMLDHALWRGGSPLQPADELGLRPGTPQTRAN